ncbi:alpha/beta hydrolase [Dermatophilaceae bacterium Soc4.6]
MIERIVSVADIDGRILTAAEWGDPKGFPVVALHGTPGSRFGRHPDEGAVRELGIRLITYDRPGYGGSTRHVGRRVVDCVRDVVAVADAFGLGQFAVTGASGGGPHCLAIAARLPDRVLRARCVVGLAPFDAEGLDFYAGMDPENIREIGLAEQGESVLQPELDRMATADLERMAADPSKLLSDDWELADADRAVLADPRIQAMAGEMMREAYRNGVWGWVDDDLAFLQPWGFDLAEIRVPVEVHYGAEDVLVPAAHGAWLAGHVPSAQVTVNKDGGHLTDLDTGLRDLRSLVAAAR